MLFGNRKKYLYLSAGGGWGRAYHCFCQGLELAMRRSLKILLDMRNVSFFRTFKTEFKSSELDLFLKIDHPRITLDSAEIDEVLRSNSNRVAIARFPDISDRIRHLIPRNHCLPAEIREILSQISQTSELEIPYGIPPKRSHLYQNIEFSEDYQRRFNRFRSQVQSLTGVHARLGNGEAKAIKSPRGRKRLGVEPEKILEAMRLNNRGPFFLATDTPSFLDRCRTVFGEDQIIFVDRYMPPENCGPGHSKGAIVSEDRKRFVTERDTVGPYALLADAHLDMMLLGECRELIGNESSLTYHARRYKDVPFVHVD